MPSRSQPESHRALAFSTYADKVRGVWAGKFIGGTLGAPIEGLKEAHDYPFDLVPDGLAENDDTDLQLLWLHALEVRGVDLTAADLMTEWLEHVRAPWNEYGVAVANWERGLLPPESGRANNWFWHECMGCPIRAEIWGVIAPGAPHIAATYAAQDASLDHGGDSVEAEKFIAAVEAALFFESDLPTLLAIGLKEVDPGSRFAALVHDVQAWSARHDWREVRARILRRYGHPEVTHVLQNVGFALTGLLAGKGDFGRTLAITLDCGYDADCTAGIAGAILGGVLGYDRLPAKLRAAIPGEYRVSDWMHGFPRTGELEALTLACCHLGRDVAATKHTGVEVPLPPVPRPAPLAVQAVAVAPLPPLPTPAFPVWRVVGPFWRPWNERRQADLRGGEHGTPTLPSIQYFCHNQSGFELEFLDPTTLAFRSPLEPEMGEAWLEADSDRLPLARLEPFAGPGSYYAVTEFSVPTPRRAWLMLGATGPLAAWLNGQPIVRCESYQPLTPTTFPVAVELPAGSNRLVLKLAQTSQPLEAYAAFKRHEGKHWHQSFYETRLLWAPAPTA